MINNNTIIAGFIVVMLCGITTITVGQNLSIAVKAGYNAYTTIVTNSEFSFNYPVYSRNRLNLTPTVGIELNYRIRGSKFGLDLIYNRFDLQLKRSFKNVSGFFVLDDYDNFPILPIFNTYNELGLGYHYEILKHKKGKLFFKNGMLLTLQQKSTIKNKEEIIENLLFKVPSTDNVLSYNHVAKELENNPASTRVYVGMQYDWKLWSHISLGLEANYIFSWQNLSSYSTFFEINNLPGYELGHRGKYITILSGQQISTNFIVRYEF